MKLHPRTLPIQQSDTRLQTILWGFQDAEQLTYVEMLGLITEHQQRIVKYMLRVERHGDADKKADEE